MTFSIVASKTIFDPADIHCTKRLNSFFFVWQKRNTYIFWSNMWVRNWFFGRTAPLIKMRETEEQKKQRKRAVWTHLCFHHRSCFWAQWVVDGDGVTQNSTAVPTAAVLLPLVHREIWTNHTRERERESRKRTVREEGGRMMCDYSQSTCRGTEKGTIIHADNIDKELSMSKKQFSHCGAEAISWSIMNIFDIICCTK